METREQAITQRLLSVANDPSVQRSLFKIVVRLDGNLSLQDDLLQEALIHFWLIYEQKPGQSLSWYLQSCRFHLLNHLSQGRSVDALKRRQARSLPDSECGAEAGLEEQAACEETVFESVSARDLVEVISQRIKPLEQATLHYLADGFGVREIAQELHVSHQAVSKHRQRIAAIAIQLGVSPSSRNARSKQNSRRWSD